MSIGRLAETRPLGFDAAIASTTGVIPAFGGIICESLSDTGEVVLVWERAYRPTRSAVPRDYPRPTTSRRDDACAAPCSERD